MSSSEGTWQRSGGKRESRVNANTSHARNGPPPRESDNYLPSQERNRNTQQYNRPGTSSSNQRLVVRTIVPAKLTKRPVGIDLCNSIEFPSLQATEPALSSRELSENNVGNKYALACKGVIEEDDDNEKAERLANGWIAFRCDPKTNKRTYSTDGVHYISTDLYVSELEESRRIESDVTWTREMTEMVERDEQASAEHYELYGEMDEYAIAKFNRQQYQEYAKQFDHVQEEDTNEHYSEDENVSDYDSDNSI